MGFENIPSGMKKERRWVGRCADKTPINPHTLKGAASNRPGSWGTFDEAVRCVGKLATYASGGKGEQSAEVVGIGFMLGDGWAGVDLDTVLDPRTGEADPVALSIMDELSSYTEISPSGYGLHIIVRADDALRLTGHKFPLPQNGIERPDGITGKTKEPELEIYSGARYLTMTGSLFGEPRPLRDRGAEVQALHDRYQAAKMGRGSRSAEPETSTPRRAAETLLDDEIVARIKRSKQRGIWEQLFERGDLSAWGGDASRADMALCYVLAFWFGRDASRMDAIFRRSALMRQKWDERHFANGQTYGEATIEAAIRNCGSVYDPQGYRQDKAVSALEDFGTAVVDDRQLTLSELKPDTSERYTRSDIGNGYLFADWYKHIARYVPERKQWFIYDGTRWGVDVGNLRAMELCKQLADALMNYAMSISDEGRKEKYIKHVTKWQRRNNRETILKDAAGVHPVRVAEFDKDPYILNCLNGTLDLRTGQFWQHRAEDMLSKVSGVSYDPAAVCERWERFIDEVMEGDRDKAAFLQKALGYTLTGDTSRECFFILYGATSRNGKSTAMTTFARLMGDYGRTASPETIAQKNSANGSAPSEDIARLAGARFVNIPEPDKQLKLSAATVKTMTGNDPITARHLHEGSFEFIPQYKIFIGTNYLPNVTDITLFKSGRVYVVTFGHHFTEEERDEGLKEELSQPQALSGVLNWAIQGLRDLEEVGFATPESVKAATQDYRDASDKIGRFISETLEPAPLGEIPTTALYQSYQIWCMQNGHRPESQPHFKDALQNYGEVVRKRPQGAGKDSNKVTLFIGYEMIQQCTNAISF